MPQFMIAARRPASSRLIVAWLGAVLATGGCAATGEPATAASPATGPAVTGVSTSPNGKSAASTATGNFKVLGREDAPVTIIEFTDLQCPYCARFARETFPRLRARYIEPGRVRFASADLPLRMHEFAVPAAVAARCAGEQGRYWAYRERLFAEQERLGTAPYAELARALGLDPQRFASCQADGRQLAEVRADMARAASAGIVSTPSFVIGRLVNGQFQGETVRGAQPYEVFASKIDALLK